MKDPGGTATTAVVTNHRRTIVGSIAEGPERKVFERQRIVCDERLLGIRDLILRPVIGSGMKVASGAGRTTVTPQLHIPEESLAEYNERLLVTYVLIEVRRLGNGDGFQ